VADRIKVLVTGALHQSAVKLFKDNPKLDVAYRPDCDRGALLGLIARAHVLVTRSETDVDRAIIEAGPLLNVIARAAVGVGNIDIDYATEKGILVINCPGKNTNSAAELTLGLLIGMLRNIPQAHAVVKAGGWDRHQFTGRELRGKRIGIVGLGNVGHRVAKFARGFDMDVVAFDPYIAPQIFELHGARRVSSLKELASQVDVLTFHVPLNKETKGMASKEILLAMPKGSWVINAARGGIFKEKDMIEALKSGHIAGLGVDTFEVEPKLNPELIGLPNIWCTPHIGASTEEAQLAIGETVYDQVVKALDGGVVDYPVNLPQVGVIQDQRVKSYAVLAEKLGSLAGQISGFNPSHVEISYRGDIAGSDHSLIRLSFLKGYVSRVVNDYVSFVNAETHAKKLGLNVTDRSDPQFDSYRSALKITLTGPEGQSLKVGGLVFDDQITRLSLINDYHFEAEPSGHILLVENEDKPGVIGDLGHFLGVKGVNIGTFELSRNRRGGRAMAVIRTDQEVSSDDHQELGKIRNILKVHRVFL
jgi:D-3-phosphoglycerate dehydrogenase / 2-oxoglutarate reductase